MYRSDICNFCPYVGFCNEICYGAYYICNKEYCEEAYAYYVEYTGDNTPIDELFFEVK